MPRTLLVAPTYNERDNIAEFIRSVRSEAPLFDILVVDDNSPDGTGLIADEIAASDSHVRVMHRPSKSGLGTAYLQAFERGLAEGYDRFFEMDADGSHDAQYLQSFVRVLDRGADVVIGSRNIPGGSVQGWGAGRHILSKGGSLYSRAILGIGVRDLTSGYKAFSRRAIEAIDLRSVKSTGYAFQIELTYRALLKKMRVVEIPIVFCDRRLGTSKMDRRIFVEAVAMVWKMRVDALLGRI